MASFKFKADYAFDEGKVINKKYLEGLSAMSVGDETRDFDDTVEADAAAIETLDQHRIFDIGTNLFQKTFTKIAV